MSPSPDRPLAPERTHTDSSAPAPADRRRPRLDRVLFLQHDQLERAASRQAPRPPDTHAATRGLVTTVEQQLDPLRAGVRDAAEAVLRWLASLHESDEPTDLHAVLDRCLRPGPDPAQLNYAALAREVEAATGVSLTPKRLRTAIRHLRAAHSRQTPPTPARAADALDRLGDRVAAALTDPPTRVATVARDRADDATALSTGSSTRARGLTLEILAAVRAAAGRLIENDFAEGLPRTIDLAAVERDLVEHLRTARQAIDRPGARAGALQRLQRSLAEYDASVAADMRLVLDGARAIDALLGPRTLPGTLGRLNVLVAGRALLPSAAYVQRLLALADHALTLHHDPDTQRLLNAARRGPRDARLPRPRRVASYALNNAATHLLQRLFTGQLAAADGSLELAHACLQRIRRDDPAFRLLPVSEAIYHTVDARLHDQYDDAHAFFHRLGPGRALRLLTDLARFDNCRPLVAAVHHAALDALPSLRQRLIRL